MYAFTSFFTFGHRLAAKTISCLALAFAADFLFYDERLGWTLGLFALGLLLAVVLHQPHLKKTALGKLASLAAAGLGFSLIEEPTYLAAVLYALTMFGLVLLPKMITNDARHIFRMIIGYFLLTGITRLWADSILLAYVRKRLRKLSGSPYGWVLRWVLPVLCSLGFVTLFAQANPIITRWVDQINFTLPEISFWRTALWVGVLSFGWALLRPKLPRRLLNRLQSNKPPKQRFTLMGLLFNNQAILTSLILFNVLFFAQNFMDVMFIWSDAALPDGMSYAEYAHRGAYPLMITALLAGFFILVAFKAEEVASKNMRTLVYIWVGQNVFLVCSSMARLAGYIAEYQLTYLRIAALIWMVMVAAGLLLIVARIGLQHSNRWLVNRNALLLYITLYACCFINFGGMIAHYNLAAEDGNYKKTPDISYLERSVGVAAIPALVKAERVGNDPLLFCMARERLQSRLNDDWHTWTFRRYRIAQIPTKGCPPINPAEPTNQGSFISPGYSLRK